MPSPERGTEPEAITKAAETPNEGTEPPGKPAEQNDIGQ